MEEGSGLNVMWKTIFILFMASFALSAYSGLGSMETKPVWDLANLYGRRAGSDKNVHAIPNSALPNSRAFTIEVTLRFGSLPEDRSFSILDQTVGETGFGLWFSTVRRMAKPLMLKVNGESYSCSYAFMRVEPGSVHTFTVTARKGWVVAYMDGLVQKSFMLSITPNLAPIAIGGKATETKLPELQDVKIESVRVWGGEEEYWGKNEPKYRSKGFKAGKGWVVEAPVEPLLDRPNLLCFGDSISDGYIKSLSQRMNGRQNLYHWMSFLWKPGRSGVPERAISEVCKLADFDCIVFNNGLHSLHWTADKVSEAEVESSYRMLVKAFRTCAPKARLIYLLTTPHSKLKNSMGKVEGLGDLNPVVVRLNRIARKVMDEENVTVIDTYAMFSGRLDLFRGDGYHLTEPAYKMISDSIFACYTNAKGMKRE